MRAARSVEHRSDVIFDKDVIMSGQRKKESETTARLGLLSRFFFSFFDSINRHLPPPTLTLLYVLVAGLFRICIFFWPSRAKRIPHTVGRFISAASTGGEW